MNDVSLQFPQARGQRSQQDERTEKVDAEDLLKFPVFHFGEGMASEKLRIVDQDVDASLFFEN